MKDITPAQINKARGIKFSFSGDRLRRIFTNPFYEEGEKVYLRAQIARINAATGIVPKGLHRFVEDSTRDIEDNNNEEGEAPKAPSTK